MKRVSPRKVDAPGYLPVEVSTWQHSGRAKVHSRSRHSPQDVAWSCWVTASSPTAPRRGSVRGDRRHYPGAAGGHRSQYHLPVVLPVVRSADEAMAPASEEYAKIDWT